MHVESVSAVLARATAFIIALEQRYSGRDILLVSHGDTLQILQAGFLRMNPGSTETCRPSSPLRSADSAWEASVPGKPWQSRASQSGVRLALWSWAASRPGGAPNRRRYSRLNCEALV